MRTLPTWLIRTLGISLVALIGYVLLFGVLDRYDINWALPWKKMFHSHWPSLTLFSSWHQTTPDGQQEAVYQVPSHILSLQEIAQLKYTPTATTNAPTSSAR